MSDIDPIVDDAIWDAVRDSNLKCTKAENHTDGAMTLTITLPITLSADVIARIRQFKCKHQPPHVPRIVARIVKTGLLRFFGDDDKPLPEQIDDAAIKYGARNA